MNALTVVSLVAAIAVASASEPILRGPSGIITAHGPIGPEGLDFGEKHGARPILEGPSGIITSAGPIGPSEMQGLRGGFKDNKGGEDGSDGRGILKGPSGIITARGPIGSSGEMAGHRGKGAAAIVLDFEGRLGHGLRLDDLKLRLDEARLGLAGLKGLEGSRGSEKSDSEGQYKEDLTEKLYDDGSWKMEDESRLIAPKMFAPKYIAPAMLQRVFRLEHSNLHLNEGRLGLSGLKFKGLGGSEGSEGQYKKDLNEKLYDDGSYKPELRLNDGHNGLAVGRFGLSGFDLKSLEGSKGPEVSEKSDSEGQYKEDLTEKLFDDGSYKPESRLIAPKIFAPKYIAPAMLQGGFRFDHLNLRLDKGRLGLSGLKFKGVEGLEGSEGQYKEDLNEKLYDDGSYKAELRLNVNDGRNGLTDARLGQLHGRYGFADGRLGLSGFDLKGLEGSRRSEESGKSDSEGQYKEDLNEKLYDDGSWKMEDESRLIAPKMFAPKYIAPAMLQRVFRLEHSNLHSNEGRLGLSGLKFKGLGGSEGSEGQYKKDLNEKLYDDGSYKPELRLNDGRNGLAVGRFGLSGFDLKSLEGSKGPEVSEKSDSEGQYKEDLTEKLFDDGSYKPESRLIAPKIFAPKYIAPAMLQGGFRLDHLNLRLDKGRLGLSGLKFKGVEGSEGSEGQYKEDLNEKLYDDGSYKAELRLNVNDGRNGLTDGRLGQLHGRYGFADGRLGFSGFDLKGLEGSRRSEESGKSDSEGQYKEDLNEKLYDDGSYKPELPLNDGRNGLAAARLVLLDGRHGMADGRFGMFHGRNAFAGLELRGFKGFEGSERSDGSEGSDEGQYKPDLTEKLYDDGSYKPELGNH